MGEKCFRRTFRTQIENASPVEETGDRIPVQIRKLPGKSAGTGNVSLLALLLTASVFFASCHNSANKRAADAQGLESLRVNQTVHLFGDTTKPACNLIVNLAYAATPADSTALRDSLKAYLLATCL